MEGDDLFAAILAHPDDDTPRLIYADWLEDHDETARAEFIRVQIEHQLRPSPELAQRMESLEFQHRAAWLIPGIKGVQEFRRGFVGHLRMEAREFVAHAERIGRTAPVTSLRLPIAVDLLGEIAAVPWLSRITRLDLTGNVGLGSRLEYFFGLAELPNLQALELRNCQLWPEHCQSLARLANTWPKLYSLNLSGNPLGDAGIAALAQADSFRGLAELSLRCDEQQLEDACRVPGAIALATSRTLTHLKSLDLNGHYIGEMGFAQIVLSSGMHHLESLDVGYNEIGVFHTTAYEPLFRSGTLPKLKRLVLHGNVVDAAALSKLVHWPKLQVMEELVLGYYPDDSEEWRIVQESPWKSKLSFAISGEDAVPHAEWMRMIRNTLEAQTHAS